MTIKPGWEGRFYEDFEVGDVYRCRIGRTITQADNIWFTLLTNNTNQIHFNEHYAERTEFGRPLVNSALTLASRLPLAASSSAMALRVVAVGTLTANGNRPSSAIRNIKRRIASEIDNPMASSASVASALVLESIRART